eukprot:RCo012128
MQRALWNASLIFCGMGVAVTFAWRRRLPDAQPQSFPSGGVLEDPKLAVVCKYGLPSSENLLLSPAFVASMCYRSRTANWVAEHLTAEDVSMRRVSRGNSSFVEDSRMPQPFRVSTADYDRSGWSRGHL